MEKLRFTFFSVLAFLMLLGISTLAEEIKFTDNWGNSGLSVERQSATGVKINFSVTEFSVDNQVINGENMQVINLPGVILPNEAGYPNLPGSSRYIAIPQGAEASVKILAYRTETYHNMEVAPAFEIPWDTDNGPLKYEKNMVVYSKDAFYPAEPVLLSKPEKIRGLDVVMLGITPFQYNPVTKDLIIYKDLQIEVSFVGGNGHFGEDRLRSRWWDPIHYDAVLNPEVIPQMDYSKVVPESKTLDYEYIIICPNDPVFKAWADSIKVWRNLQGIRTGVLTTTDVGGNTTTAIENYVNTAYNTWTIPPVAVLLLGDYGTSGNTVVSPIWNNYCVSDNIYADVDGNSMPDITFARMTAQNATHLETMITKFLNYERNPPIDPYFYAHPITALGWQTERWFQICSETVGGFWKNVMGKTPTRINAIYSGTPGTVWSTATNTSTVVSYFGPSGLGYIPATPAELGGWSGGTAAMVNNAINAGAFALQHRDHGGETGWGEPDYQSSDIDGCQNNTGNKLPWIFSINCLTGKYNYSSEVFTEKFHRYRYQNLNAGALGVTAASEVSYSFVNDAYVWGLMDNLWPNFMPAYGTTPPSRDVLPAFGNSAGKYFLQQSSWPYNTSNKEVTYNLFHSHGDAFSTVYANVPQNLTVLHDPVLLSGVTSFTVTANNGSFIALTANGEIIGTAAGTGAPVSIAIAPQTPGTTVKVTVTKQDYFRYCSAVNVIPPTGPYVTYSASVLHDAAGNNNGLADYGESITLDVTLQNLGSAVANNVVATLSTTDAYITITDNTQNFGSINPGSNSTQNNAFGFTVADNVPDQHVASFTVTVDGSTDETWVSYFVVTLNAPILSIGNMIVDDAVGGNGNFRLDPGETANITIPNTNNGHSVSPVSVGTLTSPSTFVTINTGTSNVGAIGIGSTANAVFNITVDAATPVGTAVDLNYDLAAGAYGVSKVFTTSVGLVLEDWETGTFNSFPWQFSGNANWFITNTGAYEGTYCVRSGAIGNSQSTALYVALNVGAAGTISFYRKVSSESGYDYLEFYIDGVEQAQWAGEVAWSQVSYPVTAGNHTFKWNYMKDGSAVSGSDCAWVDYIIFPAILPPAPAITVNTTSLAYGNVFIGDQVVKTFTITNSGSATLTGTITTPLGYSIASALDNTLSYTIAPGNTVTYNLTFAPTAVQTYNGDVVITHNAGGANIIITVTGAGITGLALPYSEDFEEGGQLPYPWVNATGDDFDWTPYTGATPSSSTGPDFDHTTGSGYYVYTESSSPNYPSKTANLLTPVFDLSGYGNIEAKFWYHMYGTAMGVMHLDVFVDGVWQNDLWSLSGNQGNTWIQKTVDLTAFSGKTIKLRFRGVTGTSYTSDMALDDFQMIGTGFPSIALSTNTLSKSLYPDAAADATFQVTNTGTGNLIYSCAVQYPTDDTWLTITGNGSGSVSGGASNTVTVHFDAAGMLPGTYNAQIIVTSNDPSNPTMTINATLEVLNAVILDLKAYLEGPFGTTEMYNFLNIYHYLPLAQPYNAAPWNYTGTEAVATIPTNVVDWVLIELRQTAGGASTATPATMIARQAAFILKNGKIVGLDGISKLFFTVNVTQNLYTVVWHRNHLGIMTSSPVIPVGITYTYDFSTALSKVYGGQNGQKLLATGYYGMFGGDGNADGFVNTGDKIEVWYVQVGSSGYKAGDFDMNGSVDNQDKLDIWTPNAGRGCQIPK